MKYLLSALLLFLLLPVSVQGQQNHVPNGSFEDYSSCPTGWGISSSLTGWFALRGSPDCFNTCTTSIYSSWVPSNPLGFQHAHQGSGYAGLYTYTYSNQSLSNSKEYLGASITPVIPGAIYEASMSVNLADSAHYATNDLGIYFYVSPLNVPWVTGCIDTIPQVDYSDYGPITDTTNWVRLYKTFKPEYPYANIIVGGFRVYDSTAIINVKSLYGRAYYYIDSVVVRFITGITNNFSDSMLCAGDTISVDYDLYQKYYSNNIFTVQLSQSNGSFANPINIGTRVSDTSGIITCNIPNNIANGTGYRVRIISSAPTDTSLPSDNNIKIANPDSSAINITSNSPICDGTVLNLSASTNVAPTNYSWTGPSSFNSTLQNPVINNAIPANSGDYYATLKFYGCEVKDTLSVTVKPLPAKPVANNNSPLCAGDSLHFSSSSSTSGVSYSWVGPGSFTSAAQDTSIANSTVAMSGDYIVSANLNGCNRKDTTTVLVKPLPASVTLSNNTPICAGDTLQLSSTASTTGSTYSWSGPGSFTANTQNTNGANSTAGMTGWYKMLVGLNGCTYTDSTYATIHPIPAVPNISYTNPLCVGETLNLGTTTVSGASYNWAGPNNFSSAVQNPMRSNMQFGDTGTYKLTATVNGCTSDTGTATVNINPQPFVVIFANPADSICQGDRVNFTALPNNHGGSPAYQWYVNGQASGTGTVFSTTTLNNQDVVRCDMTENTKCNTPYTDPSNDITMNVLPWLAPSATISASPNRPLKENEYVTFTATATNAGNNPQYQWKRNGQDVVGATGSVWSANTLNDNDSISVEIVSNYICPQPPDAVSNGIVVKVLTGVAGLNNINGLTLYPNPNNGKFILKSETPLRLSPKGREVLHLEIINAMGQVVYRDEVETDNGKLYKEISLHDIPVGLYMLRVQGHDDITVIRFSVQ